MTGVQTCALPICIAGLEAAIILKQRGHSPILCEASDRLGGQFLTAGEAPRKEEMKKAVISMGKKAEHIGVDIRINTKVTGEMIQEMKPHTVINAIGAQPVIPPPDSGRGAGFCHRFSCSA